MSYLSFSQEDSEVIDEPLDIVRIGSVHGYLLVANGVWRCLIG